ncbi:prepilin peptidase [Actinokineospora sp. 24-640]
MRTPGLFPALLAVTALGAAMAVADPAPAVALAAVGGLAAGASARILLNALPRGTPSPPGLCEISTAALWGLIAHQWVGGALPAWWVPTVCLVTWVAVPLVIVDLRHRRLPDALTLGMCPLLAVALAVAVVGGGAEVAVGALLGAAGFFALHALVAVARPGALGGGDVKLALPLGAVLGVLGFEALLGAVFLAAVVTLLLIAVNPRWRAGAPHGPGMLGAVCAVAISGAGLG